MSSTYTFLQIHVFIWGIYSLKDSNDLLLKKLIMHANTGRGEAGVDNTETEFNEMQLTILLHFSCELSSFAESVWDQYFYHNVSNEGSVKSQTLLPTENYHQTLQLPSAFRSFRGSFSSLFSCADATVCHFHHSNSVVFGCSSYFEQKNAGRSVFTVID